MGTQYSHNFISTDIVKALKIPIDRSSRFKVQVSDGYNEKGAGTCHNVALEMQGVKVKQNFYPFDLGGTNVVLGVEWLESLGEVKVDWKKSTLKINIDRKLVGLQGDPSLSKSKITLKTMIKTMKEGDNGYLVEFREMILAEQPIKPVPIEIQALLEEFKFAR